MVMMAEAPPQLRAEAEPGIFTPELPGPEILDEQLLHEQGSFRRVRRYLRGWHPEFGGILHMGWQGQETIVERDVIRPVKTFTVVDARTNRHSGSP